MLVELGEAVALVVAEFGKDVVLHFVVQVVLNKLHGVLIVRNIRRLPLCCDHLAHIELRLKRPSDQVPELDALGHDDA